MIIYPTHIDVEKVRSSCCLVCYGFENETHPVLPRPHGNSKGKQPYTRTQRSTIEKIKQCSSMSTKDVITTVTEDVGGLVNARSMGSLPKSREQVSYYKHRGENTSSSGRNKSEDVLYNVMLQCKSNNSDAFVRTVVAAPEPMAVLCTDQQLDDMVRFLTNPAEFSIMGVDPTFNFGDFNATPIVYRNLLLQHRTKGHCPVMLGPILVHHQKKFSSYNFFASTLISLRPTLRNVIAFGTDGEEELYKAFGTQFPNAIHLRCFRHYRANIKRKLLEMGLPPDKFLQDIFGTTNSGVHYEGLVDAKDSSDFADRLDLLEDEWSKREVECTSSNTTSFYAWFQQYKVEEIVSDLLRPIREAAGLGCPPAPYYTNASECINSVMHDKTHYKASEWDHFNESMHELVKQSYQLTEIAVIDRGAYRYRDAYRHLRVDQLKWIRMTAKQREIHLHKVAATPVVGPLDDIDQSVHVSSDSSVSDFYPLPITPEQAKLENVPLETVRGIWSKAKDLLNTPGAVVNGPRLANTDPQTVIVASKSSTKPRVISHKSQGVLSCETTCPNWAAIRICSHSVAASHFCSELDDFLAKYRKKNCTPSLSRLSKIGMPKGAGKKGDKPPRKRRCTETVHTFTAMPSVSTSASSSNRSAPSCSGHDSPASTPSSFSLPSSSGQGSPPSYQPFAGRQPLPSYQGSQSYQPFVASGLQLPSLSGHFDPANALYPYSMYSPYDYSYSARSQSQASALGPSPDMCVPRYYSPQRPPQRPSQDDLNPCVLKFVSGNIRVCQSCRASLRSSDGSLQSPPRDLCVAHLGRRQYWNSTTNEWCVPSRETNSHYCASVVCIQYSFPNFVPSSLVVSEDIRSKLNTIHKNYLLKEFTLSL